jgi:hypothetical protein
MAVDHPEATGGVDAAAEGDPRRLRERADGDHTQVGVDPVELVGRVPEVGHHAVRERLDEHVGPGDRPLERRPVIAFAQIPRDPPLVLRERGELPG